MKKKKDWGEQRVVMKCQRCGYSWVYKGKLFSTTCNKCKMKLIIKERTMDLGVRSIEPTRKDEAKELSEEIGKAEQPQA